MIMDNRQRAFYSSGSKVSKRMIKEYQEGENPFCERRKIGKRDRRPPEEEETGGNRGR